MSVRLRNWYWIGGSVPSSTTAGQFTTGEYVGFKGMEGLIYILN